MDMAGTTLTASAPFAAAERPRQGPRRLAPAGPAAPEVVRGRCHGGDLVMVTAVGVHLYCR